MLGELKVLNVQHLRQLYRRLMETVFYCLDVGANADAKPKHLLQNAYMGSIYSEKVRGIQNPRVGLLNIGTEENKGNELTKQAYEFLKKRI